MTRENNYPKHVAIILDGNRRFAKKLNLDPWKGHEFGEKKVQKLLEWSQELKIKEITLYSFSIQNFNRPKIEFEYLMKLFLHAGKSLIKKIDEGKEVPQIKFVGRTELFPENVKEMIKELENKTINISEYKLNLAFGYGGKEEIEDAIKQIATEIAAGKIQPNDIDQKLIKQHLYLQSEPDLIIRTGGEKRTSNFLMWQSSYSEWIFLEKTWPEFEQEDLINACQEYTNRQRRFGK
ncbi:di-trans,poly-cis-decaprenylcistransferase [Candidatus Woesearchaeota archaeon]|nr:di-trans,poly-cis-decaprenylcistransferase [Candidatus Woesearchaeota archaeon]MCF7901177.1 di-trans,poly-cis-decaprenylcistransferase [Candidatus Woesearchaeota archaeon]